MFKQKIIKVFKILTINLAIVLILFSIIEYLAFKKIPAYAKQSNFHYYLVKKFNYDYFKLGFRETIKGSSKKRPVLFLGCSFAYGYPLENKFTLPAIVSKLSHRTVYNRAQCAWGLQQVYYTLSRKDLKKDVPDAEYVVYVFIYDHYRRLNKYLLDASQMEMPRYEYTNGHLKQIHSSFLPFYSLYSVKLFHNYLIDCYIEHPESAYFLTEKLLLESLKEAKSKYKNSKFVILIYNECDSDTNKDSMSSKFIHGFDKKGFIVIDGEDLVGHKLSGKKYISSDNYHPSEAAWSEIAPKLVKELKL